MGGRPIPSENYFDRYQRLLDLETEAERQSLAERRRGPNRHAAEQTGETLLDLAVEDHELGLGARHLFTFVKRNRTLNLPWNRLRIGAPVLVSPVDDDHAEPQQGVVSARTTRSIQIALDHYIHAESFEIDLAGDEVSRNRERAALRAVSTARGRLAELRQLILGPLEDGGRHGRQPRLRSTSSTLTAEALASTGLNPSQCDAIAFALTAEDLAVIHGPPGTGKTTTVVEFIRQATARGERVLACAPSNTAVDNMLERLADAGQRVVRLGHPARVKESLRTHTLDAVLETHENTRIVRQLLREADALYNKADRYTRAKPAPGAKQQMRRDAKELKIEARQLERQAIDHTLDTADVVCATTAIDDWILGDRQFDWVVIDEAGQTTEPACWVPILRGNKLLLAGDHLQLPPTVVSNDAAREGLAQSMMERLVAMYGSAITRQLLIQYRMHDEIMAFSSAQFYGNTLIADESVREHRLCDLPGVAEGPLTAEPAIFIDTAGADYDEEVELDGASRFNSAEGQLVINKVEQLLEAGVAAADIAVIAPYAAQVRWLRERVKDAAIEVDTVDGFQGREKEAILISLVRSNREGEIGFLADTRRMNVALTRARRKLIVIGDSSTLGGHPFYAALLDYFQEIAGYRSVWDELY
ncbi:MAG TPA: AAA domain-containing protein [Lacipirellula sp.]